eukprot:tig00021501_g21946.t1
MTHEEPAPPELDASVAREPNAQDNVEAQQPAESLELRRRVEAEAVYRDISRCMRMQTVRGSGLQEVLRIAVGRLRDLLSADFVKVLLIRSDSSKIKELQLCWRRGDLEVPSSSRDELPGVAQLPPLVRHRIQRVLEQPNRTFFVPDCGERMPELDEGGPQGPEALAEVRAAISLVGFRSILARSTDFAGSVTGQVTVGWLEARDSVAPHEGDLFGAVCDQLGHAVAQDRLLSDLEEKNRLLEIEARLLNIEW